MNYRSESYKILSESLKEKKKYFVKISGKKFVVYPNVFSPKYFNDSKFFATKLPIKKDGSLLEIGCGTGIVSIFALIRGAAKAVCVDINSEACKNTLENAALHKLEKKIKVIRSDLFSKTNDEKFDVIFWNLPFGFTRKKLSIIEKSILDTDYRSIEKFFRKADKHLEPNGRIFIGFSKNIGNFRLLEKKALITNHDLVLVKGRSSKQSNLTGALPLKYQIYQLVPRLANFSRSSPL